MWLVMKARRPRSPGRAADSDTVGGEVSFNLWGKERGTREKEGRKRRRRRESLWTWAAGNLHQSEGSEGPASLEMLEVEERERLGG